MLTAGRQWLLSSCRSAGGGSVCLVIASPAQPDVAIQPASAGAPARPSSDKPRRSRHGEGGLDCFVVSRERDSSQ